MIATRTFAALPAVLTDVLRPLPTGPLEFLLQRLVDSILARHPGLLDRVRGQGARRFGIDPLEGLRKLYLRGKSALYCLGPASAQ